MINEGKYLLPVFTLETLLLKRQWPQSELPGRVHKLKYISLYKSEELYTFLHLGRS